jgi:hypothetical protein
VKILRVKCFAFCKQIRLELAASGLALLLAAPVVAQEPAQVPTLKATVDLVNLFATVRDKNKRMLPSANQPNRPLLAY